MHILSLLAALAAAFAVPGDFLRTEQGDLASFEYGWPAEVEAIPTLRDRLRQEMDAARADASSIAEESRRFAAEQGRDPIPQYYSKVWQVAGSTARLLSLSASNETFTGGAHGNVAFSAMLWDLAADAPVEAAALLGAGVLARMTPDYCAALDAERSIVRGSPVRRDPQDSFTSCPPLAEQVLVPTDSDGNGRFDTLVVLIAPYVAGPYAEGSYVLELSFVEEDLAGVAEGYRPAFEAGAEPDGAAPTD